MSTDYPVVVYGSSGYTGRLVIEFLREYKVPFVAAGRSKKRIEEALKYIPGIENCEHEIAEVEHTVEALTALMTGKKVMCNTVGPFSRFGEPVIEAALAANCHYLDTTGEQNFMIDMQEKFHEKFKAANLVCAPSTAYMFTVSDIAARICLETHGVDSLEVRQLAEGTPTIASTQSVVDMCRQPSFYMEDNKLFPYDEAFKFTQGVVPSGTVLNGTQWGGGSHVCFFKNDPRVRNCNFSLFPTNQGMLTSLKELELAYKVQLQWMPEDAQADVLDHLAGEVGVGWPARENRHGNRFTDWCSGRGNTVTSRCTITGGNGYQVTGLLQAWCAMQLLNDTPLKTGFLSINEVLGHREVLAALQGYGYVSMVED